MGRLLFACLLLSTAITQTTAQTTQLTGTSLPVPTDDAPGGSGASGDATYTSTGLVNYYFVFLALILCAGGLGGFFIWRRRRRAIMYMQHSRQDALAEDLSVWDPVRGRRRHWHGRRLSADVSQEEGLNEHGEAPPPYVPKPQNDEEARTGGGVEGPAIPLQTLTRDDAGLKPPDYTETGVRPLDPPVAVQRSESAASSSTMPTMPANS